MQHHIAIIGSGFSGTIAAYELVQQAKNPINIHLFDHTRFAGKGVAFSTSCPSHLLNVTVQKMSALHTQPDHLLNWLLQQPQSWRRLDPGFAKLEVHRDLFLPRMIYGAYLQHIQDLTQQIAGDKKILLNYIREQVVDIDPIDTALFAISTASRTQYRAHAAIIATGVPWARPLAKSENLSENTAYLAAPWPVLTNPETSREWLKNTVSDSEIAMVGSGLTMLDAVASLDNAGYQGQIKVISKLGLLPQPHDLSLPKIPFLANLEDFPRSAVKIFKKLRSLAKGKEKMTGFDWRSLVESLRPLTSLLWLQLPPKEKRCVLRHLFTHWNRYRHRSPPETYEIVQRYIREKRLKIVKASAVSLEADHEGKIIIDMIDTHKKIPFKASFDKVINCSGPDFDIKKNPDELHGKLLNKGIAECDELGLGLKVNHHFRLISEVQTAPCFAIGALLFGTLFETVAVPELRKQCHSVAAQVQKSLFA